MGFGYKKIDTIKHQLIINLEQAMGIEPTSQPWQGRVLAVVLRLHVKILYHIFTQNQTIFLKKIY